ncbi:MAG: GyrI-like domain-containing protein [Chitinophagaceae bacterium]|nr:GyrI-like domain-containing protein [Chitinophagaceae bacterium]
MIPVVKQMPDKLIVGRRIATSSAQYNPFELWSKFMPKRKEILNTISPELFSVQVFQENTFSSTTFNENTLFEMWAAVEVSKIEQIPTELESTIIVGGAFVTFILKGEQPTLTEHYNYIINDWLPKEGYRIDNRAHFQVMGDKYKRNDPNSEEEVWIPIAEIGEANI